MRLAALLVACTIMIMTSVRAQLPELSSSDKATPIVLRKLDVNVKIIGTRSSTIFSMTFYNAYDKVLEGTFVLPLPEGANVTRYALDINGKMREGVPVEKEKATEVFESVEKRRIDPGLLEKTEGNVFRTRVYPIPAHGERSIIIAYEQELSLNNDHEILYHLPLSSKDTLQRFTIGIDVHQKDAAPVLQSSPIKELDFMRQRGHYCAHEQRENIVLKNFLHIRIAKQSKESESFVQKKNGELYFYLQTFVPSSSKDKKLPQKLSVIWDNSLSGLSRNTAIEIKLLESYLERLGSATIQLYTLNNTFKHADTYEVRNGSAKAFIERLQKMVYDGGTDYSAIRFADADETLLFSDGLSTLSDAGHLSASHLVYTISSSPKANYGLLRSIAEQSGGSFINLAGCTAEEGLNGLTKQALLFLGIRKNKNVTEHYSATPVVVQNGFSMAGKLDAAPAVITLRLGYGKEVAFEKEVALNYDEYEIEDWDLSKLFAQKKIQELEKNYERNKDEILLLGKQYSIVTQNTSLLVLEDIMDYVRHEIEPPFELRAEYKRLLKERRDEVTRQQQNILERAIGYSNLLWEWYHTSYPVKRKPVTKYTVAEAMDMEFATVDTTAVIADGIASFDAAPPPPPSARQEANKVQEVILEVLSDSKIEEVAFNHNRFISGYEDEDGNDPKIKLEQKASKSSYLKILSQSPRYLQYQTYLELRNQNLSNPTFYYEVATFFLKQDKALGLQILTNLGELDYQNHEILKLLGFKLKELGEPNLQQYVFRKILTWRPQEPQSCRDYALVLAENGKYQAALDTLYLALTKDYNIDVMSNYKGIEETIVMEINHLISKYRSRLNSSAINHKLVHTMPLDIRVVLNWNMNDTDIDLWVTDPAGEKCFYSHKETRIGGRMSDDFTQGYGPEQFLLRKADKGKYKIQVHYYGERGVKVAGKTTLLVEVFTNYGRPTEQRKMITLQLEGEEREGVYVGEFVF